MEILQGVYWDINVALLGFVSFNSVRKLGVKACLTEDYGTNFQCFLL